MNDRELAEDLEALGVHLWEDAGQLRYRAPKGVVTEARRQLMIENKIGLLAYLRGDKDQQVFRDPTGRHDPFPLTDVQSAYLLGRGAAFNFGDAPCQLYLEIKFPPIDPAIVETAWNQLILRHDMLRAVFDSDLGQRVLADVPHYSLQAEDLRGASGPRRDAVTARFREAMDHRRYQPDQWPLFELRASREDDGLRLHVSFDFLVADYQSILILLAELEALSAAPHTPLDPLRFSFREWILTQQRHRDGVRYQRDRAYWWSRLETLPAAPDLPRLDISRGPGRFRRFSAALEPALATAFRRRAADAGLTPTAAVLAAYSEVIGHWSRRRQFTLNLTVVNRPSIHPDIGRVVGDFTTVTLLAVDLDRAIPFDERARRLHLRLIDDMDHRLCTGVEVLRELAQLRGRDAALAPVVFTSTLDQDADIFGPRSDGDRSRFITGLSQTPQVWIDCQIAEHRGELTLIWDVRDGVFPEGVPEDMFEAMAQLLRDLSEGPQAWTSQISVSTPQRQQDRRAFNSDADPPAPHERLEAAVLRQARKAPDSIAVITPERTLSYAALVAEASAAAQALRDEGIRPGDIVPIIMEKSAEQISAVLGVLMAGGAYLPLDPHHPPRRRADILDETDARVVLSHALVPADTHAGRTVIAMDKLEPARGDLADGDSDGGDDDGGGLAYVIYTSGSSGRPKGVMVTHAAALNTVQDVNRRFGVGTKDKVLALAHLGFDLSVYDIFGLLSVGGAVVLPAPDRLADPSHWADLITEHHVTVWNTVPAQMQMLQHFLDSEPGRAVPNLRLAMLSGDWIPVSLPDAIRDRTPGLQVVSLGGATEASIWSIAFPIDRVSSTWMSIPYGRPLANQRVDVLDLDLEPCPDHVAGELFIAGVGLARGYLNQAEETAERFFSHPRTGERLYRTGDFGRYEPSGDIQFLGREDRQVKIRGHRIELAEIEAAVVAHPAIGSGAVLVDDQGGDGRIAVFAATRSQFQSKSIPPLVPIAEAAGDASLSGADLGAFLRMSQRVDAAARLSMMALLGQARGAQTIADFGLALGANGPRLRLLRRWFSVLIRDGWVEGGASEPLRLLHEVTMLQARAAWREAEAALPSSSYPRRLFHYLRDCAQQLSDLMSGVADPLQLLFPYGDLDLADDIYNDNLASVYANRALAAMAAAAADGLGRPGGARLLEVGAGAGGLSAGLIAALGPDLDYLFTDISPQYLEQARSRLGAPGLRCALLDLDQDYRDQGFQPNSFDIIVAGDVLHATVDVPASLRRIRELLAPGGWLFFIEMTEEHHAFLASLEILIRLDSKTHDFKDLRAGRAQTFLSRPQWREVVAAAGGVLQAELPPPHGALASIGMCVFAVQFKTDRQAVEIGELQAYLAERLPYFMQPNMIQLVDQLPLTENGKVDVATLRSWLPKAAEPVSTQGELPQGDLERRLSDLWAETLQLQTALGRAQSILEFGGDSLTISRLCGRMRQVIPEAAGIPFDRLLRHTLQTPTVQAIAQVLSDGVSAGGRSTPEPTRPNASPLIALGGAKSGTPVVLVHDASGALDGYGALASMQTMGPVFGLLAQPDGGPQTLQTLADRYALHLVEAFGPVQLVGCGAASILALEMACRLAEAGVPPARLLLIGGELCGYGVEDELLVECAFAASLGVDPVQLGFPAQDGAWAREIQKVLEENPGRTPSGALRRVVQAPAVAQSLERLSHRSPDKRLEILKRAIGPGSAEDYETLAARFACFSSLFPQLSAHRPSLYAGGADLILSQAPLLPPAQGWDEQTFWRTLCLGGIRIISSPTEDEDTGDAFLAKANSRSLALGLSK